MARRLSDVDLTFNGRYHINKELNRGATAVVFEAMDLKNGFKVALKVLNNNLKETEHTGQEVTIEMAEREVQSARQMNHPHIVQLLEVFYSSPDKERLVIVWELVQGKDLLEVVNELCPNQLPEPRARRYFKQLLSGVRYIHDNGFCHRDIKPENCMVDAASDTLKIIDFGMTKHLESAKTLMIGTPDYMAPELLTHNLCRSGRGGEGDYDARAVDVWSMGALLFICVAGIFPFEDPLRPNDMTATLENVRLARYRALPYGTTPELADLINRMLQRKPTARITLEGIARHPWLALPEAPPPRPPTPAPASPESPVTSPSKKLRGFDKLALGMSSLRVGGGGGGGGGGTTPRGGGATSPRSGIFGASGSFKEGGGDAAAAGAVSPRFAAVKWPRWLALSQSDAKPE